MTRRVAFAALFLIGVVTVGAAFRRIEGVRRWDARPEASRRVLDEIEPAADPGALPNIVIVLADDLGAGDLGCYGSAAVATPHVDRLATEGVRMTRFYASAPVCTPSRAGLLTGRYPIRSGMNDALLRSESALGIGQRLLGTTRIGIPEDELLLPELLRARGYRTALVGKWHLGDHAPYLPNQRGFDVFYGVLHSNDIEPFEVYRDGRVEIPAPVDQRQLTQRYAAEAVRFIEESRGRPFFLYLAHTFPHIPLHASDRFRGKSAGGLYGDTVEELDWSVGEIRAALERQGIGRRTAVFFTSDNGPWYQGSPGGLRGRKRSTFEGGFRVPLVAWWPGTIPAGGVVGEASMNFDLFATALAMAGVPLPEDRIIDGRDILPVLEGRAPSPHEALYFYWRTELWAVLGRDWKYHRRHEVEDINPFPWPHNEVQGPYLFDLRRDPDESYSQIESHPDVAERLAGIMDAWDAAVAANPRGWLGRGTGRGT